MRPRKVVMKPTRMRLRHLPFLLRCEFSSLGCGAGYYGVCPYWEMVFGRIITKDGLLSGAEDMIIFAFMERLGRNCI